MEEARTVLTDGETGGLGEIVLRHPGDAFSPTAATRISVRTIGERRSLLSGTGLDWGSGTGALAIAAARVDAVTRVVGLELSPANLAVARENLRLNGVAERVALLRADSFSPAAEEGRALLAELSGRFRFLLANPPASEGDDGLGFRREVLGGGRRRLRSDGIALVQCCSVYGRERIAGLAGEVPGWRWSGVVGETPLLPFELESGVRSRQLETYLAEEERGAAPYVFVDPRPPAEEARRRRGSGGDRLSAREAAELHRATGLDPLVRWQVHRFDAEGGGGWMCGRAPRDGGSRMREGAGGGAGDRVTAAGARPGSG